MSGAPRRPAGHTVHRTFQLAGAMIGRRVRVWWPCRVACKSGERGVEVIWGLLRCDDGIVGEGLVVTPHSLPLAAVSRVRER